MKKLVFAPLAALALLAACGTDLPTSTARLDAGDALLNRGVSAAVTVSGTFQVAGAGEGGYRESGPSNNGQGTCLEGGKYMNQAGNIAQNWPHAQCTNEGATVTVSFSATANYVKASNGNVNLNFGPDTFVHYQVNQNRSRGAGTLAGSGSDGSSWTIDLGQITTTAGNVMAGDQFTVNACPASGDCVAVTLTIE
jgi:hypothetical protein